MTTSPPSCHLEPSRGTHDESEGVDIVSWEIRSNLTFSVSVYAPIFGLAQHLYTLLSNTVAASWCDMCLLSSVFGPV